MKADFGGRWRGGGGGGGEIFLQLNLLPTFSLILDK